MTILNRLSQSLTSIFGSNTTRTKTLSKEDLEKILTDNIDQHNDIITALSTGTDRELIDWMNNKVQPTLRDSNSKCKEVYDIFKKKLNSRALQMEMKRPLGSLLATNEIYVKLLSDMLKNIDKIVEEEEVDIYNARLSQIATLGIIKQSDDLAEFSAYLYSFLTRIVTQDTSNIPRNRDVILLEKAEPMANMCSDVILRGKLNFLTEIENLKKNQSDTVIGATGNFNFVAYTDARRLTPSFLDYLASALSCLNFFSAGLDLWDDFILSRYERKKELREWLANHNALLKMDLANTDPNDPRYVKLQNIIHVYDDKIAEYDREIAEFENAS